VAFRLQTKYIICPCLVLIILGNLDHFAFWLIVPSLCGHFQTGYAFRLSVPSQRDLVVNGLKLSRPSCLSSHVLGWPRRWRWKKQVDVTLAICWRTVKNDAKVTDAIGRLNDFRWQKETKTSALAIRYSPGRIVTQTESTLCSLHCT